MNLGRIKIKSKTLVLIFIIIAGILGYFIYTGFFMSDKTIISTASDSYVNATKLGRLVDTLNKESISFNTNINNEILISAQDFSVEISPSSYVGRSNPFIP